MQRKSTSISLVFVLSLVFAATCTAQDTDQPGRHSLPTNKELVTRARSFYVDSDSFYMKREHLESSLLGQKEFKAWEMQITDRRDLADLLIHVKRVPFSNHFNYTVTDRETRTVVMAGKVDSLAGTVYGQVAHEIVEKMKVYRGDPLAKPPTPKS
ncbi:MAG TPA: hypothetical protein VF532_18570 [Candidatus Angelobacter sp.]